MQQNKLNGKYLGMLDNLHIGFNSFHEIKIPFFMISKTRRFKTQHQINTFDNININNNQNQILLKNMQKSKFKLDKLKDQTDKIRQNQFNDYIRKSIRYQDLLNINDNKKKRLPTLNTKIGQVVKKSVTENISKNISYEIQVERIMLQGWKPQSREGHTTIIHKNLALIIGGHCSRPYSTAHLFQFDSQKWVKVINIYSARSYHSTVIYKQRFIIIFGGMGSYDMGLKFRGCFNNVILIDCSSWISRQMKMNNEQSVEPRRSHSALLMSKNMLIFGGMNTNKQYLKDLVYLDLKQLRWHQKDYKIEGKQLIDFMDSGIAKHKGVSFFKARKNYPLYSSDYTETDGIYYFGGFNGKGDQNIVMKLSFNKYIPTLKKLDYSGIPPSSIDPILQKYNDNLVMIISGQQTERQLRLFKIKQKHFVMVNNFIISSLLGGTGSTLNRYNNQFYIFFGLGSQGYTSGISKIALNEKIKQNSFKKKKERKMDRNWKQALQNDSDESEFSSQN